MFLCRTLDAYINCKIVATPAKYDLKPYAYGFQKDSPFLSLFDFYLNEMKEKGSLKQIQVKYDPHLKFVLITAENLWELVQFLLHLVYSFLVLD